ncbi:PsbP-related protein [Methanobrevibacter sp.]
MRSNVYKKGIFTIILILFMFAAVSCINAAEDSVDNSDVEMLTVSKGGVVINYPSNWGYSEPTSPYAILAISKLDSIDSAGVGQVSILIEKKPFEGEFYTFVNDTYQQMQRDSSYKLVSSGGTRIGNVDAVEYIYTSNSTGVEKEHKAVWVEKGGQAYVLLYSAPPSEFEDSLYIFEFILDDIQIT